MPSTEAASQTLAFGFLSLSKAVLDIWAAIRSLQAGQYALLQLFLKLPPHSSLVEINSVDSVAAASALF